MRDEAEDLAMCKAADPSEWRFGVDEDFLWCGPQSWGAGDLIEIWEHQASPEGWLQIQADCRFIAEARTALPHYILALRSEREMASRYEAALKCIATVTIAESSVGPRLIAIHALSPDGTEAK